MVASDAGKYFDGASQFYDHETSKPEDWYAPIHLRDTIAQDTKRYERALVVGAGTGRDIQILSDLSIPSVTMIDISAKMLEIAAARHPSAESHHGDFLKHGFQQKFDLRKV